MKFYNRVAILVATLLVSISPFANAQLDSCNIFLKGLHIEVGINTNGAYGSSIAAPKGFHPKGGASIYNPCYPGTCVSFGSGLGFVADPDKDGWTVGTPPYFGDYFLPGSPQEGWSLQIGKNRVDAWNGNDVCPSGNPYVYKGSATMSGTAGNKTYATTGRTHYGIWQGLFDSVLVTQKTVMDTSTVFFTVYMTLYNTSHSAKANVYYLRTVDPDNDEPEPGGSFTTKNKIEYQLPNQLNRTMVSATGQSSPSAFLGLGTLDCRAKCFIIHGSLEPIWGDLDTMYGTNEGFLDTVHYQYHDSETQDEGIGLVFKLGSIPAGDSINFAYAYVLRKGDLDSAFESTRPKWTGARDSSEHLSGDTLLVCSNSDVPLHVINGVGFHWTWDSPTGNTLSDTAGLNTIVHVGDTGVTIVRAIGNNPACASDTEYIYLRSFTPPPPIIGNNGPLCLGDTLKLFPGHISDSVTSLTWKGPNGFETHDPNPVIVNIQAADSGTYYLIDSLLGCPAQVVTTTVQIDNMFAKIGADKKAACLGAGFSVFFAGVAPDTNTTYQWGFDNATVMSGDATGAAKGPYVLEWDTVSTRVVTLRVQNWRCVSTDIDTVPVIKSPTVHFDIAPNICIGDTIKVTIPDYSLPNSDSFAWNFDNGGSIISGGTGLSKGDVYVSYANTGTKVISLTIDYTMCTSAPYLDTVNVVPLPNAKITNVSNPSMCMGDTITFTAALYSKYKYEWDPAREVTGQKGQQGEIGDLLIEHPGFVYLTVHDQYNCANMDSVAVNPQNCCGVFFPSAFTPNGDGKNDIFRPITIGHHKVKVFRIVNRYGQTVFESNVENRGWDGTLFGVPQDPGTYFYYISYDCNGKTIEEKGDLILIR